MKLRWVIREYQTVADPNFFGHQPKITGTKVVLQQMWEGHDHGSAGEWRSEWRDVPAEKETPNAKVSRGETTPEETDHVSTSARPLG